MAPRVPLAAPTVADCGSMLAVALLLRILGVELMVRLGRRLPAGGSRLLSAVVLVLANLLPIWAVLEGRFGVGDALLLYWVENLVVWFTTMVRLLTVRDPAHARRARSWVTGDRDRARLFGLRFGAFTAVHGVLSTVLIALVGLQGRLLDWAAAAALILFSHALSLGLHWFGRQERTRATAEWAMTAPYPRLLALHITVIGGFVLMGGPGSGIVDDVSAITVLMVGKLVIDLGFHVIEHLGPARATRPAPDAPAETVHEAIQRS